MLLLCAGLLCFAAACVTDNATLVARAKTQNEASYAAAEHGLFARGYRPANVPTRTLKLKGLNDGCQGERTRGASEPVEVEGGAVKGTTTYEAACALVSARANQLVVQLDGEPRATVLTRARYGAYALAPSGALVRYVLAPQVKESKRGYLEGVSCCCSAPQPITGQEPIEVFTGPDPAREDIVVPYDIVDVTLCDPKAPQ